MNRLEVFISQLDGLVVFLSAAHAEVFQTIKQNELTWFPESQNPKLPETFESFRVTVSNAAFLLGYAYFEAFLTDLARDIYLQRPTLLPREKQITFKEVLGTESKAEILQLMIEKEIRSVFYGKIETVRTHFDKIFHTLWPASTQIIEASRMRNCLMHNGGLVNRSYAYETRVHNCAKTSSKNESSQPARFRLFFKLMFFLGLGVNRSKFNAQRRNTPKFAAA